MRSFKKLRPVIRWSGRRCSSDPRSLVMETVPVQVAKSGCSGDRLIWIYILALLRQSLTLGRWVNLFKLQVSPLGMRQQYNKYVYLISNVYICIKCVYDIKYNTTCWFATLGDSLGEIQTQYAEGKESLKKEAGHSRLARGRFHKQRNLQDLFCTATGPVDVHACRPA